MKVLIKLFVFVGLILLIVGVVAWKIPASWVLGQVNWSSKGISYARVAGTLWEGNMEQLRRRDVMLGDVSWDFQTMNNFSPLESTWKVEGKGLDYELGFLLDFEVPARLRGNQAHDDAIRPGTRSGRLGRPEPGGASSFSHRTIRH
jgi:hypothetical protein